MTQTVRSADGTVNDFPDEATPDMISKALGLNRPAPQQTPIPAVQQNAAPPSVPLPGPNGQDVITPPDPVNDKIFQTTSAGGILTKADSWLGLGWLTKPAEAAFIAGSDALTEGGSLGLSQQTDEELRKAGWFNDYEKGQDSFARNVAEGILKPAAAAADTAARVVNAAASGTMAAVGGEVNYLESKFGGLNKSPDVIAHEAQDFVNYLFITAGMSEDGMPLMRNPAKTEKPAAAGKYMREGAEGPADINGPATPPSALTDKAGNINLQYINKPEDVKNVIRQVAEQNGGDNAFIEQRRGVISHKETVANAEKLIDQAANGVPDWMANWTVGKAPNAEEGTAARLVLGQSAGEVVKLAKIAQETGAEADVSAYQAALDKHTLIQQTLSGMAAESGRGLNAFGIVVPGAEEADAIAGIKKAPGMTEEDLLKIHASMDSPQQAVKLLKDARKATWGDGVLYYVINNYLSGPITHAAYAASYVAQTVIRAGIETPIASLVGKIQSLAGKTLDADQIVALKTEYKGLKDRIDEAESTQGQKMTVAEREVMKTRMEEIQSQFKKTDTVMPKEVAARFYGMGEGFIDAVKASFRAVSSGTIGRLPGETSFPNSLGRNPIIEIGKRIKNPLLSDLMQKGGRIVGIPSSVVGGIHTFQKFLSYTESLNALAYRQAAAEGLEGSMFDKATTLGARIAQLKNDPPLEMMQAATDEGKYAALMGEPGKAGKRFEDWANSNNYTKAMVPFSRVMNNINSQAFLERTPIGVLSDRVRGDLLGKNGNAAQAIAIGKMSTGLTILGAATALTAYGFAHGEAPDSAKEKNFQRLSGQIPYSVRMGNASIPLRFFGIPGRVMAIGADLYDVHQAYKESDDLTAALGMAAHALGNDVLSESGFRGIGEFYQAVTQYQRYGKFYVQNLIAQAAVPFSVGQGQIAREVDPILRQSHSVIQAIKSKTPFLSETLVPKIDIFGNPLKRNGDHSWAEKDPVMQALTQLEYYPSPVGERLSNVTLSEEQWADYATKAGKLFYLNMNEQVTNPNWTKLSGDAQRDIAEDTLKEARKMARTYMHMTYPELAKKSAKQNINLAHPE